MKPGDMAGEAVVVFPSACSGVGVGEAAARLAWEARRAKI